MQARLPGIINVPQAHINHITIKPPNALLEKVTRRQIILKDKKKKTQSAFISHPCFVLSQHYFTVVK